MQSPSLLRQVVKEFERQYLSRELVRQGWNIARTARELGISRRSLNYKLLEHKLERPAAAA